MHKGVYRTGRTHAKKSNRRLLVFLSATAVLVILGFAGFKLFGKPSSQKAAAQLNFDESITDSEKQTIQSAIKDQSFSYSGNMTASVKTSLESENTSPILSAYVPVSTAYAARQSVAKAELANLLLYIPEGTDPKIKSSLAEALGVDNQDLQEFSRDIGSIPAHTVAFVPADSLNSQLKLLAFEGSYYLDSFVSGAVFRQAEFSGSDSGSLDNIKLNNLPIKDNTLKVNMSGVTALTRVMQKKLASVKDPLYFSEKIGEFMADADITHISNEVSFREGCQYSNTLFCSPPEFIETLKDSGVDLVELTGNHNNDNGSIYNTESINLYHSLGWHTVGGGLNTIEAAKPYVADTKGSKVTFLAYNLADGAGSGAIAGATTAGANIYTDEKAESDIKAAKQDSQFVIVNIQYSECQAYPAGYVEYPQCDGPIGGQEEAFRQLIEWGANMVVGSSAHQPQTYELYKEGAIYYGLGNMYFDQTQWPGTERGIILTHYFSRGKLLQTKLSPTVYGKDLQTQLMEESEAVDLLDRLGESRP